MADSFLTLLDITKMNGSDQAVGIIEEVRTYAPESEVFGGRPIRGTTYKGLVRTALPAGPTFRAANTGTPVVKSTWDQRINQTFFLDAQMRVDEMVLDACEFGAEWALANEALGVAKEKLIALGYQFYYGNPSKTDFGFPGLCQLYDPATMEIDAGETSGSLCSSAWLVVNKPDCAEFIYGNNQGLQLKQWVAQYIPTANAQYRAFLNNLSGYVGLSFNYTKSACRIKNISLAHPLTDALVADALALFPVGVVPTHLFVNRTGRRLLQKSRVSTTQTTNVALQYAPMPTESNGIPLYVTDSLTQTENYVVLGTAGF